MAHFIFTGHIIDDDEQERSDIDDEMEDSDSDSEDGEGDDTQDDEVRCGDVTVYDVRFILEVTENLNDSVLHAI